MEDSHAHRAGSVLHVHVHIKTGRQICLQFLWNGVYNLLSNWLTLSVVCWTRCGVRFYSIKKVISLANSTLACIVDSETSKLPSTWRIAKVIDHNFDGSHQTTNNALAAGLMWNRADKNDVLLFIKRRTSAEWESIHIPSKYVSSQSFTSVSFHRIRVCGKQVNDD